MSAYQRLVQPEAVARWMVERRAMWQLTPLDGRNMSQFCKDRGLDIWVSGKHVKLLWQLALVRADLVKSVGKLKIDGLVEIDKTADDRYLYADAREPSRISEGWVGSAGELEKLPRETRLVFHPFRYYTFYRLLRLFRLGLNISPTSVLTADIETYKDSVQWCLEHFNAYTGSEDFLADVEHWNDVVSLAVATEPLTAENVFQTLRTRVDDISDLGFDLVHDQATSWGMERCS
jgi:hypothetical protein